MKHCSKLPDGDNEQRDIVIDDKGENKSVGRLIERLADH